MESAALLHLDLLSPMVLSFALGMLRDRGPRNVRIETLVTAERTDRILDHVAERGFPHSAVIAFTHPVDGCAARSSTEPRRGSERRE